MTTRKSHKARGATFETDLRDYFRRIGLDSERLARTGARDEGDVVVRKDFLGHIGVIEAKAPGQSGRIDLSGWTKEATSQIIVAHRVTSPLLMGVRTDGNGLGSNTDEIKAALYVFTKQVIEPFQRIITDAVEKILAFNGVPSQVIIEKNDIIEMQAETTVIQQSEKKKIKLAEEETSFAPTKEMAAEAELGLKWREEYKRGGTEVGVARARDISNMRNLSLDTVTRMNSYFARHEVPSILEASNIVSRIDKLESMVLELLTHERKKNIKKRTSR